MAIDVEVALLTVQRLTPRIRQCTEFEKVQVVKGKRFIVTDAFPAPDFLNDLHNTVRFCNLIAL